MPQQIKATRMEYLRLRKRLALARRGHKLLKDKLDGLIQKFLILIKEYRNLKTEGDDKLTHIFTQMAIASSLMSKEILEESIMLPNYKTEIQIETQNIMGVKIPKFTAQTAGNPICYSLAFTPSELDQASLDLADFLPKLIKLAQTNKAIELLAAHISEIKRRVKALEYILIPELENAVKFIRMKLAEIERGNIVALLKIKDLVRAKI